MATGQTLVAFTPQSASPPASGTLATFDTRNGHPVYDFDASTVEVMAFEGWLPGNYAGGGLTVTLVWAASSATSGNVRWNVYIERLDTGTDQDADSFASAQSVTAACSGTSGQPTYSNVTFTNGAQMDSLAANESFRIKVERNASDAADTMTGDAELQRVIVKET